MIKCKKIISIVMLLVIMSTTFSVNVFAGGAQSQISKSEGYTFNEKTGHLTIYNDVDFKKNISKDEIKSVTIKGSATKIVECSFYGCKNLTSVIIEEGVTYIGSFAFANCENLTSVIIPSSVDSFGFYHRRMPHGAFVRCTNLTSVTYLGKTDPHHATEIFWECRNLKEVQVPSDYQGHFFCGIIVVKGRFK